MIEPADRHRANIRRLFYSETADFYGFATGAPWTVAAATDLQPFCNH
jgi:hypothetical protein